MCRQLLLSGGEGEGGEGRRRGRGGEKERGRGGEKERGRGEEKGRGRGRGGERARGLEYSRRFSLWKTLLTSVIVDDQLCSVVSHLLRYKINSNLHTSVYCKSGSGRGHREGAAGNRQVLTCALYLSPNPLLRLRVCFQLKLALSVAHISHKNGLS